MCSKVVRPSVGLTQFHLAKYGVVLFLVLQGFSSDNSVGKKRTKYCGNMNLMTKIIISWGQESISFSSTSPHQVPVVDRVIARAGYLKPGAHGPPSMPPSPPPAPPTPPPNPILWDPFQSLVTTLGAQIYSVSFCVAKGLWSCWPPFYLFKKQNGSKILRTWFSYIFRRKSTGMQKTPLPLKSKCWPRYWDN